MLVVIDNSPTTMVSINVFIITLLYVLVSVAHGSCSNGWIQNGTTCYHFSHDKEPMLVANIACQQMGGALVEIESADENAYLAAEIRALHYSYFWIGITDIQEETVWLWNTNTELLTKPDYVNWGPGEPNNVANDENCALMGNNGLWADVACHKYFNYICEKKDTDSQIIG